MYAAPRCVVRGGGLPSFFRPVVPPLPRALRAGRHLRGGVGVRLGDPARIGEPCDARVDGQAGDGGDAVLLGKFRRLARAENFVPLAAVGTGEVAHVLDEPQDGHVHHLRHVDRLFDDHLDEVLRCGDDDDAAQRDALKDGERNVARSRGHIEEHDIDVLPQDVRPELDRRPRDEGAAPDDGVVVMLQQTVHGHELQTTHCADGIDDPLVPRRAQRRAERLGNGGARDVRVQNGGAVAARHGAHCQKGGDERLSDAPLAAHDGDGLSDARPLVKGLDEGRLVARGTVARTGRAVMRAICHIFTPYPVI